MCNIGSPCALFAGTTLPLSVDEARFETHQIEPFATDDRGLFSASPDELARFDIQSIIDHCHCSLL